MIVETQIATVLWDIGLIIILATVFNFIARAFKQPPLLAFILAGVFLGPFGFSLITKFLLGSEIHLLGGDIDLVKQLSEMGVAFLLFSVGIESDFTKLRKLSLVVILGGIIQVFFIFGFVYLLMNFFQALQPMEAVYLGLILAFSSTMVVVKLLSDNFSIDTLHGRLMIGFLLLQDVLVILILPILSNMGTIFSPGFFAGFLFSGAALFILALIMSRYVYPAIFRFSFRNSELLFLTAIASCFGFMFLAYALNLPLAIGAFVCGLSLSMLPYNFQIYEEIRGIRDFFVTFFFVTLGFQLTPVFFGVLWKTVLFSLGVVLILKPLSLYAITYLSGYGKRVSLFVSLGLAQVSEFSFLLANQGLENGLLNKEFYSATIFIIAISMVITPYIFKYEEKFYNLFKGVTLFPKSFDRKRFYNRVLWLEEGKSVSDHIVIVGSGVVGGSIARALKDTHPLIAMDQDPDVVEGMKHENVNIFLGEADNKTLWRKLRLDKAKMLVLAIPNIGSSLRLLRYAKEINPKIVVFARAHTFENASRLYEEGADYVCMPEVVGSNVFLKTIIEFLETNALNHINVLQDEFVKYLKERSKQSKKKPFVHRDSI